MTKSKVAAVDLFCGAGGLTRGLEDAGVDVRVGIDIDPASRFPYEYNNSARYIQRDVVEVSGSEIQEYLASSEYGLLAGCAPCQPFSTYSRSTKRQSSHKDWGLLREFARLIQEVSPDFVTMENVPSLAAQSVFTDFVTTLADYEVWWDIVDLSEIGVPQTRRRLVVIASKYGKVSLPSGSRRETVQSHIGHLPPIEAGEPNASDPLHVAPSLTEKNLVRIRASQPGGTWRDWPEALLAECHKRSGGATYPSVYGRMSWSEAAPTITTQCFAYGSGRFGHPDQDRAITLREAALLQTFPREYEFVPRGQRVRFSSIGRLIGNAVPVRLGQAIGEAVIDSLSVGSD